MTSAAGASYTYNTQGLRTSKTVSGKKTSFTLVGGSVWYDGTANYVWGAELITNGSVYYLYNAHGDVVQLLNASGTVTKTYDYDAYGNELTRDLADENPFRYCGEYYDTETGFIYLRARYYDPNTGRFISEDPIRDGLNWYSYCDGNPVGYFDPSGLKRKNKNRYQDVDLSLTSLGNVLLKAEDALKQGWRGLKKLLLSNTGLYKSRNMTMKGNNSKQGNASLIALYNRSYHSDLENGNDPTYNTYVIGQDTHPYNLYKNGISGVGSSGCEAIAIHNARVALGYNSSLKDVLWAIDEADAYSLGGLFGTNAYSLSRVFDFYGMYYSRIDITQMTMDGVYVISYWNGRKLSEGFHTMTVVYENGKYIAYNDYNKAKDVYKHFKPSRYKDSFICGYYLGK